MGSIMAILKLSITNWEKYNKAHHNIRSPWWFALSNTILEDPDFQNFTNDELIVWLHCLCLASKSRSNIITYDEKYLTVYRRMPAICQTSAIRKLKKNGHLTQIRVRDVRTTGHNITEQDIPPTPKGGCDWQGLVNTWNENRGDLPAAATPNPRRIQTIQARLKEEPDLNNWAAVVRRVAASDFCRGRVKRTDGKNSWVASFGWLIRTETRLKVLEGTYDNRAPTAAPPAPGKRIEIVTSRE